MTKISNRIGPFHYADPADIHRRKIEGREFVLGIATAYNAFGLIGTEYNGLFVLDDTDKKVVLDRHAEGPAGGFGPTDQQRAAFEELKRAEPHAFLAFIRSNPRTRPDYKGEAA